MSDPVMSALIETFRRYTPQRNLEKLLRDHVPTYGHCSACRTVGPCTLYLAALAARRPDGTS